MFTAYSLVNRIKRKVWCLVLFVATHHTLPSQNLVPNGSFESYTLCPNFASQIQSAIPWGGNNNNSQEYFNACASPYYNVPYSAPGGFQPARTGVAYAGQWFLNGFTGYKEYIRSMLNLPLQANRCYLVKYYVNYPNQGLKFACNGFGAYLSDISFTIGDSHPVGYTTHIMRYGNPIIKDTLGWVEIGGIYVANGGEKYITIGNFNSDANTDTLRTNYGNYSGCYYHMDDISVEEVSSPTWSLRDTTINLGDSVLIGPLYSGLTCIWKNMLGVQIGTGSGMYVKPTVDTKYVLEQTFCGNTFYDTIEVKINTGIGLKENFLRTKRSRLYPNPNNGSFNIKVDQVGMEPKEILIFDVSNRLVYQESNPLGTHELNMKYDLLNGTYLLKVKFADGSYDVHRLLIIK